MRKQQLGAAIRRRFNDAGESRWQVRWRERCKQFARSFTDRASAEEFAHKVGIVKEVHSVMADSLGQPGRLKELIPDYVDLLRARNKSGSGHAPQVEDLLKLGIKRMHVVWTSDIDTTAFDRLVRAYGVHRSSLKKSISSFKTFLRWARSCRWIVDQWVFDYKAPKYTPEERVAWNEHQEKRLLAECAKPNAANTLPSGDGSGRGSQAIMDRMLATREYKTRMAVLPALELMLRYAPRPIEVTKLQVGNWDAPSRTLSLPAKITKTGYARSFVLDGDTAAILDQVAGARPSKEVLFRSYKGRPYQSHHLTDLINRLIERAGLPGTAYCCRHTATTKLLRLSGSDLPLVQSITGHRTLSELQRYLHATSERRHAIAEAYDSADQETAPPQTQLRLVK